MSHICPIGPIPGGGTTPSRTRAFIKVQDGCRNFCSYCIVPLVRPDESCVAPEQVISELKQRQAEGYNEVVITGVEVGSYHYSPSPSFMSLKNSHSGLISDLDIRALAFPPEEAGLEPVHYDSLSSLLTLILSETTIPRLRLSSLQPQEVTQELIKLWRNPRLCRHFHLSLQSGSDTVLKRMNRRYTTGEYSRAVDLIRSVVPDAAITTDIITGFPGETDKEFKESYEFCKRMKFARIHVFPYSPRKGTKAAGLGGMVDEKVKKSRTGLMLKLGEGCISNFSRKFLGKTIPVLFEQREKDGFWSGLTDNYIRVYTEREENLTNEIIQVRLVEVRVEGVLGEITTTL